MKRWLQRLRGAVGTALVWAAGWSGAGVVFALLGLFGSLAPAEYAVFAGVFAMMGFISGAAFSAVLSITEGRRRFDEMSLPRFAAWGAVGGVLLQLVMIGLGQGAGIPMIVFSAFAGAGFASGSLALARRADDKELLDSGAGVAEIGLTDQEKRKLLGRE